jgi:hypothetical protein
MLYNFRIDILVKFAVVSEDSFYFFYLIEYESILFDERADGKPSSCELIVNGYEIIEFLVVDSILKLFDLIIERKHEIFDEIIT